MHVLESCAGCAVCPAIITLPREIGFEAESSSEIKSVVLAFPPAREENDTVNRQLLPEGSWLGQLLLDSAKSEFPTKAKLRADAGPPVLVTAIV